MKRRRFLTMLARTPILGSAGYLASATHAQGTNAPAKAATLHAQGAGNATPLPTIDPRSVALLVMDYQPAWIQTLTDSDALLSRAAQAIAIARDGDTHVA